MDNLLDLGLKGGPFMIPLGLLFLYSLYLIIERYRYISRKAKVDRALMKNVQQNIKRGAFNEALQLVSTNQSAFGTVMKEGIQAANSDATQSQIEANMEKVANIEIGMMEKNLGHLGLIAGIAPTLGFIGTISGVIRIFREISESGNVGIKDISGGLYEKMISSGAGLMVGIIAYSGYHLLNSLVDAYVLRIQKANMEFLKSTENAN
jgi:biopolymer transport protein ExbB